MDNSIRQRLLQSENNFLTAVSDSTIGLFEREWSNLCTDIHEAAQCGDLIEETSALAASVSSRLEILGDNLANFFVKSEALSASLTSDLEGIVAQHITKHGTTRGPSSDTENTSQSRSTPSTFDKPFPCPPYVMSAYKWLRHNIYKPYPTVEEIKTICEYSDTSEKRIRNWFISARRRMGWAKIAKEHFHSDREDTADAAYRALVEPDPKRPIDAKLMFEFVKMEVAAEGMYSSAFKPSQFVGSLGTTVMGMSTEHKAWIEEMRQQAIEGENLRKEVEHKMKRQRMTKRNGSQRKLVSLYPSPERSSCSSPEPTLVLSETEEDEITVLQPNASTGRKRCHFSSSDTVDIPADKRLGSATATSPAHPSTSLPSPSASAEDIILDYQASSGVLPVDSKLPTLSHTSRKHRLSDADAQRSPKRPRRLAVGHRLHTVSDPLPISNAVVHASEFQNWNMPNFGFNFELPSTVTSQPLDPSVPIDVEVFNWTNNLTFSNEFFSPNTSSLSPIAAQQVHLPASELFSPTDPAFDMSGSVDAFDQFLHDMLLQPTESQVSDVSTISQTSSLVPQPPTDSVSAVSHDWLRYAESVLPAQNPVIIDSSIQPYGSINLFAIPNFDPSTLEPHSPSPADIIAQSEAAVKQLKLERCYAHLEAAMKLQQEITTGSDP